MAEFVVEPAPLQEPNSNMNGEIIDGQFGVGEESIEAGLFDEESIPWDELAFASIKRTLRYFFAIKIRISFVVVYRHGKIKCCCVNVA